MYCIECGERQPLNAARYCPFCGTALYGATAVRLEPQTLDRTRWVPWVDEVQRLRQRRRKLLIITAGAAIVWCGAAAVWWFMRPPSVALETVETLAPAESAAPSASGVPATPRP